MCRHSLSRLWVPHSSFHSASHAASPRRRNRRALRPSLIWRRWASTRVRAATAWRTSSTTREQRRELASCTAGPVAETNSPELQRPTPHRHVALPPPAPTPRSGRSAPSAHRPRPRVKPARNRQGGAMATASRSIILRDRYLGSPPGRQLGRAGGPAPAADERSGLSTGPVPWGFESVSWGFNSGPAAARD